MIKQLKFFIEDEMGKLDYDYKPDKTWGRLDVDEVEKLKLDEDEVFFNCPECDNKLPKALVNCLNI